MSAETFISRRKFVTTTVKAVALASVVPLGKTINQVSAATCVRPYGAGLYGVACFPGHALLSVPAQANIVGEGFKYTLLGEPGRTYRLFTSENLTNWVPAGFVQMPTNGSPQSITDSEAKGSNARFYRAEAQ